MLNPMVSIFCKRRATILENHLSKASFRDNGILLKWENKRFLRKSGYETKSIGPQGSDLHYTWLCVTPSALRIWFFRI